MNARLSRQHWVYRAWDGEGRLLYIGCTSDPGMRWKGHRSRSQWWPQVARLELVEFPNGWDALREERLAIIAEAPIHNVCHKRAVPAA